MADPVDPPPVVCKFHGAWCGSNHSDAWGITNPEVYYRYRFVNDKDIEGASMTTGDGFDDTLAYLIGEAVNRLSVEDRQERIEHCQRTGQHGVRMVLEEDGSARFVWGGKALLLADERGHGSYAAT